LEFRRRYSRAYQKASNAPDKRGDGTEKPADADHQKIASSHQQLVALVRGTSWQALLRPYWYADRRVLIEEIKALHRHTPSFPNRDDCAEWLAEEYRPGLSLDGLGCLITARMTLLTHSGPWFGPEKT
jgi:hypothetical protein